MRPSYGKDKSKGIVCSVCGVPALTYERIGTKQLGACGAHSESLKEAIKLRMGRCEAQQSAQRDYAIHEKRLNSNTRGKRHFRQT